MRRLLLPALAALLALPARAELGDGPTVLPGMADEPSTSPWRVSGGVWTMSPVALDTGMPVGAAIDLRRRVGGPFVAGARLGYALSTEANRSWVLRDDHGLAALSFGVEKTTGVATLHAQLGVGALGIRQQARRHQYERLLVLNVPDIERLGWTLSPSAWLEGGLALQLRAGWCLMLSGGPTFARPVVAGTGVTRWGVQTLLGVFRAL